MKIEVIKVRNGFVVSDPYYSGNSIPALNRIILVEETDMISTPDLAFKIGQAIIALFKPEGINEQK